MEREDFLSGYCRQLDGSRTVTVVTEDGRLTEVDCCYGSCLYEGDCPVARRIGELVSGQQTVIT